MRLLIVLPDNETLEQSVVFCVASKNEYGFSEVVGGHAFDYRLGLDLPVDNGHDVAVALGELLEGLDVGFHVAV